MRAVLNRDGSLSPWSRPAAGGGRDANWPWISRRRP